MPLTPGQNFGPYRLVSLLGRGGMATVWEAVQPSLGRTVAIKVLPDFLSEDPAFQERFKIEALTIAKLRHTNILQVYDYGVDPAGAYLVTEFVAGGTLSERLGQPLTVEETCRLLTPVASALDYAHVHGVLHRDVKPSNILLSQDDVPVLADFGLAKMAESSEGLTRTGVALGTPEYMSPEQASGEPAVPASDRYALAVIAYQMLTGSVPFKAETPIATLFAHLHKPLPLPQERNPALSDATQTVLLKGLAKNPEDRYQASHDFIVALSESKFSNAAVTSVVVGGTTTLAQAASKAAPVQPGAKTVTNEPVSLLGRNRTLIAGVVLLTLVLAGSGAFALLHKDAVEEPAPQPAATTSNLSPSLSPGRGLRTPGAGGPGGPNASPAGSGALVKGAPLWSANMRVAANEVREVQTHGPAGSAVFGTSSGWRFTLSQPEATLVTTLNYKPAAPYLAEMRLRVEPGSVMTFAWVLRASDDSASPASREVLVLNTKEETLYLQYIDVAGGVQRATPLAAPIHVPGISSGKAVTIAARVTRSNTDIFVDGSHEARGGETKLPDSHVPIAFNAYTGGKGGALEITAMAVYRPGQ